MKVKRYAVLAFVYAVIAMAGGVFYREFTKFSGFVGETRLSVVHTHYFVLGMFFFLILLLLENSFSLSGRKAMRPFMVLYNIGLNVTGITLFCRGLAQATNTALSRGMDAALSGVAGLGHIMLGLALILMLAALNKCIKKAA